MRSVNNSLYLIHFRWVNIGKERDGMSPDAVQYARALRPPYHLLSFLRIKGKSTKGMSCTDKNTMVSFLEFLHQRSSNFFTRLNWSIYEN